MAEPHIPVLSRPRAWACALAIALVAVIVSAGPASAGKAGSQPPSGVRASTASNHNTTVNDDAYWLVGADGTVYTFGGVSNYGALPAGTQAVDLEPTPDDQGYWVLDTGGTVHPFGSAGNFGSTDTSVFQGGERASSISATPTGEGYWIFTDRGRVQARGDAVFYGDVSGFTLNGPVLDSVPTPTGLGYYMIASDGGVFSFGDADFYGSTGGIALNEPVVGLTPDPDGIGYWLVAADGGLFAFEAPFMGSIPALLTPGQQLNAPIIGAVGYGNAYLMVASDGGVFNFATDREFQGSLGGQVLSSPIVGLAPANGTVVGTGDIRVTATWSNTNDIDLWVVTPAGERIYFGNDIGATGGALDVDANAGCGEATTRPVENIFWATGTAPAGTYQVYVNLWSQCGENATATPVNVEVVLGATTAFSGQVIATTPNDVDDFANAVLVHTFTI